MPFGSKYCTSKIELLKKIAHHEGVNSEKAYRYIAYDNFIAPHNGLGEMKNLHTSSFKDPNNINQDFLTKLQELKKTYSNLEDFLNARNELYSEYPADIRSILKHEFSEEKIYSKYFAEGIEARDSFKAYADSLSKAADEFDRAFIAVVKAPTGTGKSIQIAETLNKVPKYVQSLVVVPNLTLEKQLLKDILRANPDKKITHLSSAPNLKDSQGEKIEYGTHGDIVIGVRNSMSNILDEETGKVKGNFRPGFVILDEAHKHYQSPEDEKDEEDGKVVLQEVLAALNEYMPAFMLFSATPDALTTVMPSKEAYVYHQMGNQILYCPVSRTAENFLSFLDSTRVKKIHDISLAEAIRREWLAPIDWFELNVEEKKGKKLDLKTSEETGDFTLNSVKKSLGEYSNEISEATVEHYKNEFKKDGLQSISICPSIDFAKELAEKFGKNGEPAAVVSSKGIWTVDAKGKVTKRKDSEKQDVFDEYERGDLRHMTTVEMLNEGWSSNVASVCYYLTPTKSYSKYIQAIGRVLRLNIGEDGISTKRAKVVDLFMNSLQGKRCMNLPLALAEMPQSQIDEDKGETFTSHIQKKKDKDTKPKDKKDEIYKQYKTIPKIIEFIKNRIAAPVIKDRIRLVINLTPNEKTNLKVREDILKSKLISKLEKECEEFEKIATGEELEDFPAITNDSEYHPLIWHKAKDGFVDDFNEWFEDLDKIPFSAYIRTLKDKKPAKGEPIYKLSFVKAFLREKRPNIKIEDGYISPDAYDDLISDKTVADLTYFSRLEQALNLEDRGKTHQEILVNLQSPFLQTKEDLEQLLNDIRSKAGVLSLNLLGDTGVNDKSLDFLNSTRVGINPDSGERDLYFLHDKYFKFIQNLAKKPFFADERDYRDNELFLKFFTKLDNLKREFNSGPYQVSADQNDSKSKIKSGFSSKIHFNTKKDLADFIVKVLEYKELLAPEMIQAYKDEKYIHNDIADMVKGEVINMRNNNVSVANLIMHFNELGSIEEVGEDYFNSAVKFLKDYLGNFKGDNKLTKTVDDKGQLIDAISRELLTGKHRNEIIQAVIGAIF
ncbi:MAG: DEAD/DEAH box helicase family protein [Candidatus Caenarcaniphilales bacterium]|nr:DEAD/DEAH box helicase family protein [Candidatus Caenarcaniphilales bacterium]